MSKKVNYPYGLSLTLACSGIIVFSYLAFLGLVFHYKGAMLKPILLSAVGLAILIKCLITMCKSKSERQWRRGLPKEIGVSLLALCILGLGSVPVSRFLSVWEKEMAVKNATHETISSIVAMPAAYGTYVDERIKSYKAKLSDLKENSKEYNQAVKGAGGKNKDEKVNSICSSLRRRIYPTGLDSLFQKRNEWLISLPPFNPWNIYAARNIRIIGETGTDWGEKLVKLSSTFYLAEDAEPFSHLQLSNKLQSFENEYTRYCPPSYKGVLALLFCFFLILLPYLIIRRPTTGYSGS